MPGLGLAYGLAFRAGAGLGSPAAKALMIQDLQRGTDDGTNLLDNLIIVTEPQLQAVNVLNFAAGGTITTGAVLGGEVLTQEGTATLTPGVGTITVGVGTVSQISIDGVLTFPCEEGIDLPYNVVSTTAPQITDITGGVWATSDLVPSWFHLNGGSRTSDTYAITEPAGGYDRDYNPLTASIGESFDVLATLAADATGTVGSWNITNPQGVTTYNPNTASIATFMDVLSTIANEIESLPVATAYTITEPAARIRTYNPNTDTTGVAMDVLATLLLDLQEEGLIQ